MRALREIERLRRHGYRRRRWSIAWVSILTASLVSLLIIFHLVPRVEDLLEGTSSNGALVTQPGQETLFNPHRDTIVGVGSATPTATADIPGRVSLNPHHPENRSDTGSARESNVVAFFREQYFDRLPSRLGWNENPYCSQPTSRHFRTLQWRRSDVSSEVRSYLEWNVLISVVTGHVNDYARIKMARCTWLGHVPPQNLFFVTDTFWQPQDGPRDSIGNETSELYKYGHWFATESDKREGNASPAGAFRGLETNSSQVTLSSVFLKRFDYVHRFGRERRPVGWVRAQLRFFEAFNVMYRHVQALQQHQASAGAAEHNFYRWFSVIDDDTFLHLDGLVASLHYHDVKGFLAATAGVWMPLALGAAAESGDLKESSPLITEAASQWRTECERVLKRNRQQRGLPVFLLNLNLRTCESHLDTLVALIRRAANLKDVSHHADSILSQENRSGHLASESNRGGTVKSVGAFVERISRLCGNAVLFLNDLDTISTADHLGFTSSREERAALSDIWRLSNELVRPPWVALYFQPATKMPRASLAGAGHYVNARAFHLHLMGRERAADDDPPLVPVTPVSLSQQTQSPPPRPTSLLRYPYVQPCVFVHLRSGRASDEALRGCAGLLGIRAEQDPVFTDLTAGDLLHAPPESMSRVRATEHPAWIGGDVDEEVLAVATGGDRLPYRCRSRLLPRRCPMQATTAATNVKSSVHARWKSDDKAHPSASLMSTNVLAEGMESRWQFLTSDAIVYWASGHYKMELANPVEEMQHRGVVERPIVALTPARQRQRALFVDLAAFRVKLYYEAIYYPADLTTTAGEVYGLSDRAVASRLLALVGTRERFLFPSQWNDEVFAREERCLNYFLAMRQANASSLQ